MAALQPLVQAIWVISAILIPLGASPHLVPEMNCMHLICEVPDPCRVENGLPFEIVDRAKHARAHDEALKRQLLDGFGHQARAHFTPHKILGLLTPADAPGI